MSDAKTNALKTRWWIDSNRSNPGIGIVRENTGSTDPQYISPNEVKAVTAFCVVEDEEFIKDGEHLWSFNGVETPAETEVGSYIEFTTLTAHGLSVGNNVNISQAIQSFYIGLRSQIREVIDSTTFTLEGITYPTTPSLGADTVYINSDIQYFDSSGGIQSSESPAIPDEFHEAIVDYALSKAYETRPDGLQHATYFKLKWDSAIREGKTYANQGNDGSTYIIKQHSY